MRKGFNGIESSKETYKNSYPNSVEILTHQSGYKIVESNLLGDKKGLKHWNLVVVWVINLQVQIYRFIVYVRVCLVKENIIKRDMFVSFN